MVPSCRDQISFGHSTNIISDSAVSKVTQILRFAVITLSGFDQVGGLYREFLRSIRGV